ncbi:ac81-like protein [Hyphantria cunea granulovirus]|uniref:Ac81-like protein n=1 Tax=Hyphantria cunea granulovirus TaxID=307448 RepID=A0AAF1D298_9BBAC|nr:ac81-like protein [Hyphantria cunea granulovirus]QBQ01644.1 ac81-like protein [Hyphantria cunea granulovirus]
MIGEVLTGKRVKFDSELLIKYVFDYKSKPINNDPNVIKICRVKVQKTGGAVLAHFFAKIYLSNGFQFEFHPGSQPKTFQNIQDTDHSPFQVLILCDNCCKQELTSYVEGENSFNIAFNNCEEILCKRKSVQTVLGIVLMAVLVINIVHFNTINLIVIIFILLILYLSNNYMLTNPTIVYCPHMHNFAQH